MVRTSKAESHLLKSVISHFALRKATAETSSLLDALATVNPQGGQYPLWLKNMQTLNRIRPLNIMQGMSLNRSILGPRGCVGPCSPASHYPSETDRRWWLRKIHEPQALLCLSAEAWTLNPTPQTLNPKP